MIIKKLIIRLKGKPVKQKVDQPMPMTLRQAFTNYIHDCRENHTFAEPTIDSYEIIRDKHLHYIMNDNIFELTERNVQAALNGEIAKGLSVSTVKKYRTVLLRVFEAYRPDFKPTLTVISREAQLKKMAEGA